MRDKSLGEAHDSYQSMHEVSSQITISWHQAKLHHFHEMTMQHGETTDERQKSRGSTR